jgi:hypothetical protein
LIIFFLLNHRRGKSIIMKYSGKSKIPAKEEVQRENGGFSSLG